MPPLALALLAAISAPRLLDVLAPVIGIGAGLILIILLAPAHVRRMRFWRRLVG